MRLSRGAKIAITGAAMSVVTATTVTGTATTAFVSGERIITTVVMAAIGVAITNCGAITVATAPPTTAPITATTARWATPIRAACTTIARSAQAGAGATTTPAASTTTAATDS